MQKLVLANKKRFVIFLLVIIVIVVGVILLVTSSKDKDEVLWESYVDAHEQYLSLKDDAINTSIEKDISTTTEKITDFKDSLQEISEEVNKDIAKIDDGKDKEEITKAEKTYAKYVTGYINASYEFSDYLETYIEDNSRDNLNEVIKDMEYLNYLEIEVLGARNTYLKEQGKSSEEISEAMKDYNGEVKSNEDLSPKTGQLTTYAKQKNQNPSAFDISVYNAYVDHDYSYVEETYGISTKQLDALVKWVPAMFENLNKRISGN